MSDKYKSGKVGKWESLKANVTPSFTCPRVRLVNLILIVFFALFLSTPFCAQTTDSQDESNMYERIEVLTDSLRAWSQSIPIYEIDSLSEDFPIDSTVLAGWFPGSTISVIDSLKTALISYPKYMDLFTTDIQYDFTDGTKDSSEEHWTVPIRVKDQTLVLDSIIFPAPENIVLNLELINILQNRLTSLRTIGLPFGAGVDWHTGLRDELIVTVRGRDIIELPYFQDNLMFSLRQIAAGMQVYAGILSLSGNNNTLNVDYYLLITYPDAQGHHFIELSESLKNIVEGWKTTDMKAIFTPYIRTDNLKGLFAKPKETGREPLELRIDR